MSRLLEEYQKKISRFSQSHWEVSALAIWTRRAEDNRHTRSTPTTFKQSHCWCRKQTVSIAFPIKLTLREQPHAHAALHPHWQAQQQLSWPCTHSSSWVCCHRQLRGFHILLQRSLKLSFIYMQKKFLVYSEVISYNSAKRLGALKPG